MISINTAFFKKLIFILLKNQLLQEERNTASVKLCSFIIKPYVTVVLIGLFSLLKYKVPMPYSHIDALVIRIKHQNLTM